MSELFRTSPEPHLFGAEGELVLLRVTADPKLLEDLLDALARLNFPVNPELLHRPGAVDVEFPAYAAQVESVRSALRAFGFDAGSLRVINMLMAAATA